MAGFTPLRTVVGGDEETNSGFQPLHEVNLGQREKRNLFSAAISSGIDDVQGLGYSAIGGVADAVGANSVRDWANEQARRQQIDSALNGRPDLERIEDQSLGTAVPYAAYQVLKQAPLMGAIMGAELVPGVGQIATATGLARAGAAAPRIMGGGGLRAGADFAARRAALAQGESLASESVMGSALGYGSLYGESVEGGNPSPYASALLAIPYGIAEAAVPAAVRGTLRAPADVAGGISSRMLKTGAMGFAGEAGTEGFQNELEMGMRSDLSPEEMYSRRLNSMVAGGLTGGALGSLGGIRTNRTVDQGNFDITQRGQQQPQGPIPQLGFSPLAGTPIVFPDGSVALNADQELQARYGQGMPAAQIPGTDEGVVNTQQPAAPVSSVFDDVDRALMDRGVKPNKLRKDLYNELQASGLDPDHESLSVFWTEMAQNHNAKAKNALAEAIIASKKEQSNVSTSSAPVAEAGASGVGPGPVADGSVGARGPATPVNAGGSLVAGNTGTAASQVSPVGGAGVQSSTVVNTQQQKGDPFQVAPEVDENTLEIARATGNTGLESVVNDSELSTSAPQEVSEYDKERIVKARFGNSKSAERDGQILMAYMTAMRNAPKGSKLKIQKAIGQQYGVGADRVRQVGNPQELAAAGEQLGFTREQVFEMFGVNDNAKGDSSEAGKLKYQIQQNKKAYAQATTDLRKQRLSKVMSIRAEQLAKVKEKEEQARADAVSSGLKAAGVEFDAEEGSGMGGLDEDRLWQEDSTSGNDAANDILRIDAKINSLRETMEEYQAQGMEDVAADINEQIEAETAKMEALMQSLAAAPKAKKDEPKVKRVKKTEAKTEEAVDENLTDAEKAERAWDAVANEYPDAPKWADLTKDQQADFLEYGEENWTPDDVRTELTKLAKEMNSPAADVLEAVASNGTEIDENDVKVDQELRGKTFEEAVQWAVANARNEFERAVMRAVSSRLTDLAKRGMVFRFFITPEGKQLTGGASGLTVSTPAGLGDAMRVDVVLNGAHTGATSGTNYKTLVHELIHAATQAQLKFGINGIAREFHEFYSELAKGIRARQAAGKSHPWEKRFWKGANNSLRDADELLAWGLTDEDFQKYLNDIEVAPKQTLWDRFVKLVGKALGIPVRANSALARFMSLSEGLLDESMDSYVAEANSRFQSLGKQDNNTIFPSWSLNADFGAPVWVEGDLALYRGQSISGSTIYVPGMRTGDTSSTAKVDVNNFSGKQISAADLAKLRKVADGFRTQTNAMVPNITPKAVQKPVGDLTRVLKVMGSKALNTLMFSNDLFNRAASMGISAAKELGALYQKRAALTGQIEREVIRIEQMFNAIKDSERQSANNFVREMRFAKKWGFTPKWRSSSVEMDAGLEAAFTALSPEAQAWAKAVFQHGDKMRELKQTAVRNAYDSIYDGRIAEAKKAKDNIKVGELEKEKEAELKRFTRLFKSDERNPYAPVRRFGNWVVVGKSQEYMDAEEAGDKEKMAKLESDADHYFVDFRESFGEADKLAKDLNASGLVAGEPREKEDARNDMYGGMMQAFDKLRGNIESELGNATDAAEKKALRAAREVVVDLYLRSLADTSARKSELRFKGVAGDIDMLRSFSSQGRADAHFLAAATFNPQMTEAITKMRKQKKTPGNETQKTMAFNEIMARHEQSMKYKEGGWFDVANRASAVTSAWMLATSPMYYLQNLTQPMVISVPYMSGKFEYDKVWGQLMRAYHEMGPLLKSAKVGEGFDFSKVPDDVRDAILELVNRGRIDIGMDTELGKVKLEGDSLGAKVANRTSQFFRTIGQKAEAINRVSTAMAAYRLAVKNGKSATEALDYADEVLANTHGDYTSANAPRVFNTEMGKVALQFRKFQLIQLTLLAKMTHEAFKGATPAERGAARKMLAYTLGHTGVLAGVVGMPGFAAASFIINSLANLLGDDDEPYNVENELRKALGDGEFARIVMRGLPMAAGMDLSGKVGMGNALSILPYSNMDMTRAGFNEIATGLTLGATGGLGARVWEALGDIKNGDYYRGLSGLMPKGLADAMRGFDAATNGISRRNGDTLVGADEVSSFEAFAKAIGLTTATESERKFDQGVAYETKQAFERRTSQIKNQYVSARREGDTDAAQKAMQAWKNLQASRKEAGFTVQPVSVLLKAPMEQKKRDRNVSGGVQYDRNSKRMVLAQTAN